jgi:hypothetical protein
MSDTEIILWLALIALFGCYVWIKRRQMQRALSGPSDPAGWNGKGIDVSELIPKVEDVRRDYLAARQPAKGLCFHRALIELARQAMAELAYFHEREPDDRVNVHNP